MLNILRRGLCLMTALCLLSGTATAAGGGSGTARSGEGETGDGGAAASDSTAEGAASDSTAEAPYEGYIVKLADTARLQSAAGKSLLRRGFLSQLRGISGGLYRVDSASTVEQLERSGLVEYAEPDYIVTLGPLPDDTYLTTGDQWYYSLLGLDECYERGITGQGVRVGIIDSGIYPDHEEFTGTSIVPGTNYTAAVGSAARSDTTDDYGHGTMVSGLIAASTGNGAGIAGAAPSVELVALKAFRGSSGKVSAIIDAIYGGVDDYHCQVLNMSLGMEQNSAALRAAVQHAHEQGVIVVAAAGNRKTAGERTGDDPPYYPAAWPEAVGVGAVDRNLMSPWFSFHNDSVLISAPGSGICGPSYQGQTKYNTDCIGTSYAAPLVTAAAALCLSVRPALTPDAFADLLRDTAWDLGEPGYDTAFGCGLLNVGLMLAALNGDTAWQAACYNRAYTGGERLLLAGYNGDGCLVYVHGAASGAAIPQAAERWRLYVLDGETLAPVREPYTLWGSPWTPPQAPADAA